MTKADLFIAIFTGHMFGDFVLQSSDMFVGKWYDSIKGYLRCFEHTIAYTICMVFFLKIICGFWIPLECLYFIFVSHFIVDKFPIVVWFMSFLKNMDSPLNRKLLSEITSTAFRTEQDMKLHIKRFKERVLVDEDTFIGSMFYVVEYIIIDSCFHFFLTYFFMIWWLNL